MKVSSIIKTPVRVEGNLIYELMDSATRTGRPIQVNKWTASVQGENSEELAHAIARAVNEYDSDKDLIRRLVGMVKEMEMQIPLSNSDFDKELDSLLAEAQGEKEGETK